MKDLLPEIIKTDPCRDLKAKLAEIEANIQRLNQERDDLVDDIQNIYTEWEDMQDGYY